MSRKRIPNTAVVLEELRQIAYEGLSFTENPYDRERYRKLGRIVATSYSALTGLTAKTISDRFRSDFGAVTPKLGVNALIVDKEGRLLLCRRTDDGRWGMPGGWVDPCESVERAIVREVKEETGLRIRTGGILLSFSRRPALGQQPHGSVHLVIACQIAGGQIRLSHELQEVAFMYPTAKLHWHRDHRRQAQAAVKQLGIGR